MNARKHWALHVTPLQPAYCPVCEQPVRSTDSTGLRPKVVTYAPCGCTETVG